MTEPTAGNPHLTPSKRRPANTRSPGPKIEVTTGYGLLQYLPFGVFERFSVHCHSHYPCDFEHWQNGLYMKFGEVLVLGSVSHNKKCSTIKLTARAPAHKLQSLWKTLLLLLQEVQKLLQEWPGMNYVRFTVCPMCTRLGAESPYHFTCNWFNAHKLRKDRAACKNRETGDVHDVDLNHIFPSNEILKELHNCDGNMNSLQEDGALPEEIVDGIAKLLGPDWPKLARKLGMGGEVDAIKCDNKDDTQEQAAQIIIKCRRKHGSNSKRRIIIALKELEWSEPAEYIETHIQKCSNE